MKVLSVFGTRPEVIKMAPLLQALENEPLIDSVVCVTGQHRQMIDPLLNFFGIRPDHDLNVMVAGQSLNGLCARVVAGMDKVLELEQPDLVLVHGDTTSASACAVAAFHRKIAIGHVEAGLRTHNLAQPYPEEMNRRIIDSISSWLFAPTALSKENLLRENLSGTLVVTGNTVIDTLAMTCARMIRNPEMTSVMQHTYPWVDQNKKLILVTGHRRENFGDGFDQICRALKQLAARGDVQIVYPVHMNPAVHVVVQRELSTLHNIRLIAPLNYSDFVWFMQQAYLILTDSGGVQEEAPHLGKPVLVMRDVTERPEAILAGTATLVGTSEEKIIAEVTKLLDNGMYYSAVSGRINPYGDGLAAQRIVSALCQRAFEEFCPLLPLDVAA